MYLRYILKHVSAEQTYYFKVLLKMYGRSTCTKTITVLNLYFKVIAQWFQRISNVLEISTAFV